MELEQIREERMKKAQIRARSLKMNEEEKTSSYFLSLEKANYINKNMMEIYYLKENLVTQREDISKAQKDFLPNI